MTGRHALGEHVPALPADGPVWIAPGAQVSGRVTLRAHASVWFNAVIRADTETVEVGEGSNVQDGAVLHSDPGFPLVIGRNCTIGHRAIVHGCRLGDGCLVGMGAIVMNGARIGPGALVGAGAIVTEGKEIPAGALVLGAPGKVVRMLDDAAREGLLGTARGYVALAARYRAELAPVPG